MQIKQLNIPGYELVVTADEPASRYRAIVAIHNNKLGPAVGGTRLWSYRSQDDALEDALRLARGMTYKSAAAGLPLGGGKSVIMADGAGPIDREQLFRAHGRFIESLGGKYITAEDVGTSPADMAYIRQETKYVAGLQDASGDPSPWTARGVLRGIEASAQWKWGSGELAGTRVLIQGAGHVGSSLAEYSSQAGARVFVSDIDASKVSRIVQSCGAHAVPPEAIFDVETDIFAPCALGGIITESVVPRLRAAIVAGAANNQLRTPRQADELSARGIVYAPDYVVNAGGIINGCIELIGWTRQQATAKVDAIKETVLQVFEIARKESISPATAADRLAESRFQ